MRVLATIGVLLLLVGVAGADDRRQLRGQVTDAKTGQPVEGATVFVAGVGGLQHELATDRRGQYAVKVRPGEYHVIFAFGKSRTSETVAVADGDATLDGRLDLAGEVIVMHDTPPVVVTARPANDSVLRVWPYSDRAMLSDAWTRAWLLLEVTPEGEVARFKFLNRPGYDLEKIAVTEAFTLRFQPARDKDGKPVRSWVVWGSEWPASSFLQNTSPVHRKYNHIPCKGSGRPWVINSKYFVGYRDCSAPDLAKVDDKNEPWWLPPGP